MEEALLEVHGGKECLLVLALGSARAERIARTKTVPVSLCTVWCITIHHLSPA